jgi:hypothetical protein
MLSLSCAESNEGKSYSFIGYKENNPVFYESMSGKLVLRLEDKTEVIESFESNRYPIFISNNFTVLRTDNEEGITLELKNNGDIKKYFIGNKLYCYTGFDGGFYYTDNKTMKVVLLTLNEKMVTNYSGCVVGYELGYLYASKEHDANLISANADIFKHNTKNQEKPSRVATNISGEMTYILPGGKYIFDQILHDGEFKPTITNISTKKFAILNIGSEYGGCYYSYQDGALIFYKPSTLESKIIIIPNEFNISR